MPSKEAIMATTQTKDTIAWTHDADAALEQARKSGRLVLADFSAAPA
jgi:hypothetical protein